MCHVQKKLQQAYSSAEVKALEAVTALSFAADIGINRAILEGDSLEVIIALSQDAPIMSSIGPWIDDAKVYSNSFFFFKKIAILSYKKRM